MALEDTLHDIMYAFYKNPGAFASQWLNGNGVPDVNTPGKKGDYYVDLDTDFYYYYDGTSWTLAGTLASGPIGPEGPAGPEGPQGPPGNDGADGADGPPGPPLNIKGTVDTWANLPGTGTLGDAWIIADQPGYMAVWTEAGAWEELPGLEGPQGPPGNDGATGPQGPQGLQGPPGNDGQDGQDGLGVPAGGTTNQVLAKASNADNDTTWVDQSGGGGGLDPGTTSGALLKWNGSAWVEADDLIDATNDFTVNKFNATFGETGEVQVRTNQVTIDSNDGSNQTLITATPYELRLASDVVVSEGRLDLATNPASIPGSPYNGLMWKGADGKIYARSGGATVEVGGGGGGADIPNGTIHGQMLVWNPFKAGGAGWDIATALRDDGTVVSRGPLVVKADGTNDVLRAEDTRVKLNLNGGDNPYLEILEDDGTTISKGLTLIGEQSFKYDGSLWESGGSLFAQIDGRTFELGLSAPVNVVASAGATAVLPNTVDQHDITMSQNCVFTFPTPTEPGFVFALTLRGAFTPTFPASVDWDSGTPPTYSPVAVYTFVTTDAGVNWRGSLVGGAYA